jgi:hypothetical protein
MVLTVVEDTKNDIDPLWLQFTPRHMKASLSLLSLNELRKVMSPTDRRKSKTILIRLILVHVETLRTEYHHLAVNDQQSSVDVFHFFLYCSNRHAPRISFVVDCLFPPWEKIEPVSESELLCLVLAHCSLLRWHSDFSLPKEMGVN